MTVANLVVELPDLVARIADDPVAIGHNAVNLAAKDGGIGGCDTVLEGACRPDDTRIVVGTLKHAWPELVVQDAARNIAVAAEDPAVASMKQFFVYRSQLDFEAWNTKGATLETDDTMIHVLLGEESMTLVNAGPGTETYVLSAIVAFDVRQRRIGGPRL
jgi:hypothetical protein